VFKLVLFEVVVKQVLWVMSLLVGCLSVFFTGDALGNDACVNKCTFVLKNEKTQAYTVMNEKRANTAFTPYSTFKIANTLIAIETGVVKNLQQKLSFNREKYTIEKWWPSIWYEAPLPIRTAFQRSAVPIYQEIAMQIGEPNMQRYLNGFHYGNADISSGLDTFWLNGSIKISAKEQVEFLQRLFNKQLPIADSTLALFKGIMLVEETEEYKLYAKTGGGGIKKGAAIGWYVGVVEKADNRYYFAVNIEERSFKALQKKRIDVARAALKKAGVL